MTPPEAIRAAITRARTAGLTIEPGASFTLATDRVTACCALGAVLLANGLGPADSVMRAGPILGVNAWWLRRFMLGFDRGFVAAILNDKGEVVGHDEVGTLGVSVRRWCR